MVRYFLTLFFILSTIISYSQKLDDTFNGYLLPTVYVGRTDDTLSFRGGFKSANGRYDGTELDTTCILVVESDANCYYLPIVDITLKGSVIAASVVDTTGDLASIPSGKSAIFKPTSRKFLIPQIAGIPSTLSSCIFNYNYDILNNIDNNWHENEPYDSLDIVTNKYDGQIYVLEASTSVGQRPDLYPAVWTLISAKNAASSSIDTNIIDANLLGAEIESLILESKKINVNVSLTDTATFNRTVYIPFPDSIQDNTDIDVLFTANNSDQYYIIQAADNSYFFLEDESRFTDQLAIIRGEKITINKRDGILTIKSNRKFIEPLYVSDSYDPQYESDIITYRSKKFRTYKILPTGIDSSSNLVKILPDKAAYGNNFITHSSDMMRNLSLTCSETNEGWAIGSPLRDNIVDSDLLKPDGKTSIRKIVPVSGTTSLYTKVIDICTQTVQFTAGDKLTFSMWIWVDDAAHTVSLSEIGIYERPVATATYTALAPLQTLSNSSIKPGWNRYEFNFTLTSGTQGAGFAPAVRFRVTYIVGDQMAFDGSQLELTEKASPYKETANDTSSIIRDVDPYVYAIPYIDNGVLDLTSYPIETKLKTQDLKDAFNFCETSGLCNVVIASHVLLDEPLVMNEYITWDGGTRKEFTNIEVDINDDTQSAVTFDNPGTIYADAQRIKNLTFNVLTPINKVIDMVAGNENYLIDTDVDGNDLANYGVYIGKQGGLGNVGSHIIGGSVVECLESSIVYDNAGNNHEIIGTNILRSKVGIYANGASLLYIKNAQIEDHDSLNIDVALANTMYIEQCYFENDSCYFRNMDVLEIRGSRISDAPFVLENVAGFDIHTNKLYQLSGVKIIGDPNNTSGSITRNWYQVTRELRDQKLYFENNSRVSFGEDNHDDVAARASYSYTHKLRINQGELIQGGLQGTTTISDTLVSNKMILAGREENRLVQSDSFAADGVYATGTVQVFNNAVTAPDGTMTADLLVGLGNQSGTASFTSRTMDAITQGQQITVAIWVKDMKQNGNSSGNIIVRPAGSTDYYLGTTNNKDWELIGIVIDSVAANSSTFTKRLARWVTGDSIAYWRQIVNTGPHPLLAERYGTQTTTTPVYNTDVTIGIPNGLAFEGNLANADSVKWVVETPDPGDTVQLSYNTFVLPTGAGTIYLDDANITTNAQVKVMAPTGTVTLSKVGAGSPFFIERGSSTSNPTIVGTGATKTFLYHASTENLLLTEELTEGGTLLTFGTIIQSTGTYVVKNGDFISIDANAAPASADWTATLDISGLASGSRFEVYIGDADVYSVGLTTSTLADISYEAMSVTDTIDFFHRKVHKLICTVLSGTLLVYEDDVSFWGGMFVLDTDPDTLTFSGGSTTPQKATGLTEGDVNGFTYSSGRLTYHGPTRYFKVTCYLSLSFSESTTVIEGWVYKNGSEVSKTEFHRAIGTGGDVGSTAFGGILELADGNYLEAFFAPGAHTGDDELIIENMNFTITKI